MITTNAQALAEFSRLCPPSVCPALSTNWNAVDERQQIAVTGTPTSGQLAITLVNPVTLISATATEDYNATAAEIQTALIALPNVASGDVVCTGGPLPGIPIAVQFGGEYAGLDVATITTTNTFNAGSVAISVLIAGLPAGEVPTILNEHRRGTIWQASTAYDLDAAIIPPLVNRNGHHYRLIRYTDTNTDQKSGASEPNWLTFRDSLIEDGHCIWQEDGDDWGAVLWDFQAAARDGWLAKAAKAIASTDIATPSGMSVKGSQLYDHCIDQSKRHFPVYVF